VAHTLSAGLLTGTLFVVSVSAFYLLRRRHLAVARFSLALSLPMAGLALVATVWSGHSSGRQVMAQQPMKFAAMEAHWGEHEGPAPLTLLAVPDMSSQTNRYALAVPKLLSWLATHSEESPRGMRELVARAEQQIGAALQEPHGPEGTGWRQLYQRTAQRHEAWASLTDAQRLHAAALASRPSVPTLFVSFRVMVGCAVVLGFAIASALLTQRRRLLKGGNRAELRLLMVCLPLPWLATFAGWTLAEVGRQPWIIYEQMTTARAAVALPGTAQAVGQLMAFVVIYALLGMLFSLAARWLLLRGPERRVWPAPWRERALGFVTSVMSRSGAQRLLARASADTVMRR
jgi:cytochrome d ubiquinol oxidase subunit I